MSFFNFTKIKVNYDYDGHKISTEVLPYKTIKHLKDIARTIFFSITSDFKLFYGQKDLSLYENNLIAEFFKNKSIISLKIVPIKKINKNKSQKLKQLVYTPNSNSKSNILMNSYNNNNYSNTINNNNSGKKVNNYKIKNLFKREQLKCEQCKNDIISNYCRICKKFICNECRFNSHELHKISQIDSENLVESSKLYAFTLQREILTNFKITKFYNNKIKVKNQISTRKDKITDLLNQIDIKYEKILKEINLDLNNNEENNNNNEEFINNMLNKYEIQTKDANEEIDNIINDIYLNFTKQRKKMTFETFRDYISILNEKDEEISLISKDLYKYKINFEIIEKINNMYDKIEKIILDVLNSKQIFGVDDETNKMYKMIKKQNENNNNNNNNINEEDDEEEKNAVKGKMKFKKRYVIDANKKKKDEEKNEDDLLYNEDEEVEMNNLNKNVDDNNNNNSENAIEQREEDKKEVNYSENNNEINDENNRDKNSEKYYYNENNNEYNNNENENNKNTDNINDNSNINVINNNEIEMDNNNNNDINIQTNEKNSLELNENNNNDNKDQIFFEKEEMEDNNIVKNLN